MTEPTSIKTGSAPAAAEHAPSADTAANGGPQKERTASLWADAGRDLIRNPVFVVSSIVILIVLSMALVPSLWTSADPTDCDINFAKQPPGDGHPFGFSIQGCDYYAQTIYGAGPSIAVAVFATLGAVTLGSLIGILSGYYGGWVDAVLSRLTDIFLGLPFLLGALTLLSLLPVRNVWTVVIALIAMGWTSVARIMRGSVIATKNMDYVQAARSLGASDARIIFRHVLPNAIAPVIVVATIALGGYVATEATLTFLGVGLRPPTVSWGVMITQGQQLVLSGVPHLLLFPVGFLVATVLAFILIGDALRDALDPKLR